MTSAMEARLGALEARVSALEGGFRAYHEERIEGWKGIQDALRCSRQTAWEYSRRDRDPLPVDTDPSGRVRIWRSALEAWAGRNSLSLVTLRRLREMEDELAAVRAELSAIRSGEPAAAPPRPAVFKREKRGGQVEEPSHAGE